MGREEWLLTEEIQKQLDLTVEALEQLDEFERHAVLDDFNNTDDDRHDIAIDVFSFHLQRALRAIGALAERLGILSIEREVSALRMDSVHLRSTSRTSDGVMHSKALSSAYACFAPLSAMTDARAITAHGILRNIISKTAVILNNQGQVPSNESEVRNAVREVCSYSLPDAIKEVGIPKLRKHYRGDLGFPSLRTMVEFKFVDSKEEMKTALDGVYADMKGYKHRDWGTFYSVFYMTGPFYIQEDVEREFELVGADRSWTPLVVQGSGKRKSLTKTVCPVVGHT